MAKSELEESTNLNLQFDSAGLLPAVVQDAFSGEVLMVAYVNQEAVQITINSGYATFWSRSRNSIWKKGETSGNLMKIKEILVDCDQDCLIFKVDPSLGGACHTKNEKGKFRNSCFYRKVDSITQKLVVIEK